MKIIIPMAGLGSRFQNVADINPEYKKPKPFINVRNFPMVKWATGSLPFLKNLGSEVATKDLIFIIRKEHNDEHNIEKKLQELYSNDIHIVIQDTPAVGATDSVLRAKHLRVICIILVSFAAPPLPVRCRGRRRLASRVLLHFEAKGWLMLTTLSKGLGRTATVCPASAARGRCPCTARSHRDSRP